MAETISQAHLRLMLNAAVDRIRLHHTRLSQLDAAVGDGDHGTTLLRSMEAVATAVAASADCSLQEMLSRVAWAILSCDGGSTGPLLGSFFMGMSDAVAGKQELDGPALAVAFEAGVAKMRKQSRAQQGDKTMMDALLPALATLRSAGPDSDPKTILRQAAEAAAAGAEDTKNMRAKFGRARSLGDRVIGHLDPGAVSISLILQGFSEGAQEGLSRTL